MSIGLPVIAKLTGLASRERPIISVKATNYLITPIEVVVGIRIAGVYVASNLETIRLRASEVIVYRKIPRESIFSEDLGTKPIANVDEDDKFKGTTYNYIYLYIILKK